jgi:LCP family protein required for cell wall assembly
LGKKKNYKPAHAKKKSHIWMWVLMVVVFLVAAAAGALFASSSLFDTEKLDRKDKKEFTMLVAKDKATVMIMGVDERADDAGRSDTLMFASIDPKKRQASLLSIPRDTRVKIKGYGWDKINAAYAYGGRRLTQSTVEDFLDTPVDHYISINTRAFPRIIDAIGGIDINVEKRMYYIDEWDDAVPGGLVIDLYPGMQHMDGVTAMSYVRYRDEEGDIGRIARQQKFMRAVMDKVTSPSIIMKLPSAVSEVISSVDTDLSVRQLLEFAGALKEAQVNGLHTEMVEGRPLYIDGISYWIPDITKTRRQLASMLGITMSQRALAEMEREDAEYESSIPDGASEVPEDDKSIGRILNPRRDSRDAKNSNDIRDSRDLRDPSGRPLPSLPAGPQSKLPPSAASSEDADEEETESRTENSRTTAPTVPTAPSAPSAPVAPSTNVPSMGSSGKNR